MMLKTKEHTYIPAKGSNSPYGKDDHQTRLIYPRYPCSWHPILIKKSQHKKIWIGRSLKSTRTRSVCHKS